MINVKINNSNGEMVISPFVIMMAKTTEKLLNEIPLLIKIANKYHVRVLNTDEDIVNTYELVVGGRIDDENLDNYCDYLTQLGYDPYYGDEDSVKGIPCRVIDLNPDWHVRVQEVKQEKKGNKEKVEAAKAENKREEEVKAKVV